MCHTRLKLTVEYVPNLYEYNAGYWPLFGVQTCFGNRIRFRHQVKVEGEGSACVLTVTRNICDVTETVFHCLWLHAYTLIYEVWQSSRTRHRVLAVAAVDRNLSMVWWPWYISVSQLCCCWSMAVSFWVASIIVWVCFVCRSENVGAWISAVSVREFLAVKQVTVLEHYLFTESRPQWLFSVIEDKGIIER
jgi:hypothetical protein